MSQTAMKNRAWHLVTRPEAGLDERHFELREAPVPDPGPGEVLVRTVYLSLDPTHRLWVRAEPTYMPPVGLGEVMRGFTLGVVEASQNDDYPVGTVVTGVLGWQEYSISDCSGADLMGPVVMDERLPLTSRFTLFEHIGVTAYFGILDVLKVQPGETLVVSAAAGAVGSVAVQIGKLAGARVIAIAGSEEKCRWLTDELGADVAINRRTESLTEAIAAAAPDGVDAFFDNTGGAALEAVLANLALHARIAMVGAISQYEDDDAIGPANFYNMLNQRARIDAFMVFDYLADPAAWAKANAELEQWALEGRIKTRLDIVDGLDEAPRALRRLFDGTNQGKLLIQVSSEEGLRGSQD